MLTSDVYICNRVMLAKCHVETIHIPFQIYQVLIVKLFPAGSKAYPVEYFDKHQYFTRYK
jgi:hypothetical protein